jgi:NADPH-dependent 2,4-dienoyl-CoA reductase/sulfur reductase-like enzyme/rhodanese-related sulfurtransferase
MSVKIVIVGGVAGGASAAARARRLSEEAEIVIVERGSEPSFANCGLPYYVGGQIHARENLLVAPKQQLIDRYHLDVRTRQTVCRIDRCGKRVAILAAGENEPYWESYDKLILSPGAAPLRPPIPGIELPGVHTLRNLEDADRLRALVQDNHSTAVVIGAGFIGLEMAENLVQRGVRTTVVELADQILPPWDPEMVAPLAAHLSQQGVELLLADAASELVEQEGRVSVRLKSGRERLADLVILSVGVRPESQLAQDAGLEIGTRGGIVVNQFMQTSDPDIYAVGDAVQTQDAMTGDPVQIPLAGPANRQGRIAADHALGRDTAYRGTQGTAIVGLFGMAAAMTGRSEKTLRREGVAYRTAVVHPAHHAGYYPGAQPLTLKILFDSETGDLLGAQAVGGEGVDKRIDVLSMAIQAGMTVFDLEEAELAYAPQFGSAKDPVNMVGFVAAGMLRGDHPVADVSQWVQQPPRDWMLIDVRTPQEFAAGAIDGAVNIPLEQLRSRLSEIDSSRPLAVYCQVGQRGYQATRLLMQRGYNVRNLAGGYRSYQHAELAASFRQTAEALV